MDQSISILIVNNHQLFRECLASVLAEKEKVTVVDVAADPSDALNKVKAHQPDIALIDMNLPNNGAIGLTQEISLLLPQVKVIILGSIEAEADIVRCIEAGAKGYVLKQASLNDLRIALDRVMHGEIVCTPRIVHSIFSRLAEFARQYEQVESLTLTSREMEILQLIADGLSNKEIAGRLYLSLHTVKKHVHNILEKLQVPHRLQAVEYACKKRWLKKAKSGKA